MKAIERRTTGSYRLLVSGVVSPARTDPSRSAPPSRVTGTTGRRRLSPIRRVPGMTGSAISSPTSRRCLSDLSRACPASSARI
jgi:hypothetical protein